MNHFIPSSCGRFPFTRLYKRFDSLTPSRRSLLKRGMNGQSFDFRDLNGVFLTVRDIPGF